MFHNIPSAADTATPEDALVDSENSFALSSAPTVADSDISEHSAPHVQIMAVSATEWLVTDHAINEDDPAALLGFIQTVGTAFEVTNLARPRERAYFTSFDRATASLLRGVLA